VTLDRALADHNLAVAIPIIQALGARGETRAAHASPAGGDGQLVRALYYPDRRVQFAAVAALLNMPPAETPVAATRTVDVLRRFAGSQWRRMALVVFPAAERTAELRKALGEAGYGIDAAASLKEAFARIRSSSDYDFILIAPDLPEYELPNVLTQLRSDADAGTVPVLLLAPPNRRAGLARFAQTRRNVKVLPEAFLAKPEELKKEIHAAIKAVEMPDTFLKAPQEQRGWLEADFRASSYQELLGERELYGKYAMEMLRRMAVGELPGYDVRRAEPEVLAALRVGDLAPAALEILGRYPGYQAQRRLAAFVLDAKQGVLRIKAAEELNRHVKKNGVQLIPEQVTDLRALFTAPATDPNLRSQLAVLVGQMQPTTGQTGTRLLRFDPTAPMPK
jgi:CheY-like chemotaxis protein